MATSMSVFLAGSHKVRGPCSPGFVDRKQLIQVEDYLARRCSQAARTRFATMCVAGDVSRECIITKYKTDDFSRSVTSPEEFWSPLPVPGPLAIPKTTTTNIPTPTTPHAPAPRDEISRSGYPNPLTLMFLSL